MAKRKATADSKSAKIQKSIRMVIDTGKYLFGLKAATKKVMHGQGKLVVYSANAPVDELAELEKYCALAQIPTHKYPGSSLELGSVCARPFPISAIWINDAGDSSILKLVHEE